MRLYIVRHAWAERRDENRYPDDSLRPLTAAGRKRFRAVAAILAGRAMRPELIATSPYLRCLQTAEILAESLDPGPRIVQVSCLMPGGSLEETVGWLRDQESQEIACVGHAPDVEEMTVALLGAGQARISFAKGGVAALEWPDAPSLGTGLLKWFVTAKVLGC